MNAFSTTQKLSAYAIIAAVIISGAYTFVGKAFVTSEQQSTDDAFVTADFTVIAPKIPGFIADVLVEDNQHVRAGQLLARIDDRDYQAALRSAEAGVMAAKATLEQANASLDQQQAVIAQARANVNSGHADVTFAQQEFRRYSALVKLGVGSVQNADQAQSKIETTTAKSDFNQASLLAAQHQVTVLTAQRAKAEGELQRAEAELKKPS